MENQDLPISQLVLATELDGREILPFAKDNGNGALLVSLLKSFIREGLATQSAVEGKQNKLTAGFGIEITPDNKIKSTLDVSPFKVVDTLPTADIENKIYLIPDPEGDPGSNEYVEYLYVGGKWEMLGKFSPSIDLTPYTKTADAEKTYAKKSEIPDTSNFVERSVVNTLAEQVAQLVTSVTSMKNKLDTIPAIPLNDGKCYALVNGAWSVIADVTESVVTMASDVADDDTQASNGDSTVQ